MAPSTVAKNAARTEVPLSPPLQEGGREGPMMQNMEVFHGRKREAMSPFHATP